MEQLDDFKAALQDADNLMIAVTDYVVQAREVFPACTDAVLTVERVKQIKILQTDRTETDNGSYVLRPGS